MAAVDKELEIFQKYIATRKILIADESATARSGVFQILSQIGAKPQQIGLASTLQAAEEEIARRKPDIVIAEFDFGKGCGLGLLQSQRANNPDSKKSLFILLTGNTSQTAVARAAEEDCDAFVIKPFTPDMLRKTLMKAALFKINPSQYFKLIEAGKDALARGDAEAAEKLFIEAVPLDSKPSLAQYYIGQCKFFRKVLDQAEGAYDEGLQYNKIHYKCMVGLFELLMELKAHSRAYEVVKRVSQYFPANPKRLTEVLRLAIINKQYDDVEKYYAMFCNIDVRNDTLVNYVCAALVVCGKYYLQTGSRSRALELFQKAAVTSAGRTKILKEIVLSLMDNKLGAETPKFLERFPHDQRSTPEYLLLEVLVVNAVGTAVDVINRGNKLLAKGIADERLYEVLVQRFMEARSWSSAENLIQDAIGKYPAQKPRFEALLEELNQASGKKAKAAAAKSAG